MDANIRVYVSLAGLEFAGCDVVVGFRAVNFFRETRVISTTSSYRSIVKQVLKAFLHNRAIVYVRQKSTRIRIRREEESNPSSIPKGFWC